MVDRDTLYEQYEEAVLALLMEQVADAEGEELLQQNRSLQADPAAAVPAETEKRCLDVLRRQSRKTRRQRTARRSLRIAARIAAALVSLLVLYAIAFAASETVRVHTLNFLIRECDVGTQFLFPGDESAEESEEFASHILSIAEETVPEGFRHVSSEDNPLISIFCFENAEDEQITVKYVNLEDISGKIIIDTENAEVIRQTISGQEVMIVYKDYAPGSAQPDTMYQIVWICKEQQYWIAVEGSNVALEELLPLVESLIV